MIARNTELRRQGRHARGGARSRRRSRRACWPARAVLSQPHPTAKSVPGRGQRAVPRPTCSASAWTCSARYRQGYALRSAQLGDHRRCAATPELVVLEVLSHYATGVDRACRSRHAAGAPAPTAPRSLPDPRSMFLGLHYFARRACPAEPMAARKADARVGYFTSALHGLQRRPRAHAARSATSTAGGSRRRIRRRRCPSRSSRSSTGSTARFRSSTAPAITAGVLEWNKAFEQIGFKNAVAGAACSPDDAEFDTLDVGRASIRWMTNASPALRRDRPEPRRSAQRRDPRRRHRRSRACRRATGARRAPRCWPNGADWNRFGSAAGRRSSAARPRSARLRLRRRRPPSR